MYTNTFNRLIPEILKNEGGFVDHPYDPGGATNFGITQKTLNRYRRARQQAPLSVRQLTVPQAKEIYWAEYFVAPGLYRLRGVELRLVYKVFDLGINMGPERAVRFLQEALNITLNGDLKVDEVLGRRTAAAARRAKPQECLHFLKFRAAYHYVGLTKRNPKTQVFLKGWLRRLAKDYPKASASHHKST